MCGKPGIEPSKEVGKDAPQHQEGGQDHRARATAATALMRPPPWLNAFRPACAAPSRAQDPNNLRIEIP